MITKFVENIYILYYIYYLKKYINSTSIKGTIFTSYAKVNDERLSRTTDRTLTQKALTLTPGLRSPLTLILVIRTQR